LNQEETFEAPTVAEFDRLLNRLDAQGHTMITLQGDGDTHMTIGGGDGRYVVYATFDNEVFWNLLQPEQAEGTITLNAGGQEGDYPASHVVSRERARQAGVTFLQISELDPALEWEKA
jgi:hypothetical protein